MKTRTRNNQLRRLCVASAVAALGMSAAHAETFKIGVLSLLSGPAAESFGQPNINAIKLMVDKINKGEVPAPYSGKGIAGMQLESKRTTQTVLH